MRPLLKVPTVSAIQKGVDCILVPRLREIRQKESHGAVSLNERWALFFFFIYIGLGAKENKFKNRNLKNSRV